MMRKLKTRQPEVEDFALLTRAGVTRRIADLELEEVEGLVARTLPGVRVGKRLRYPADAVARFAESGGTAAARESAMLPRASAR